MYTEYDLELANASGEVSANNGSSRSALLGQPLPVETVKEIVAQADRLVKDWVLIRADLYYLEDYSLYAYNDIAANNGGIVCLVNTDEIIDCAVWGIDRSAWENFIRIERDAKILDSIR